MLGCMLAGSFTVMIGFQACVNMACVTGIAPVTGKALPLISYGGSSLLATMIMIGVILSVSFRSKVGMSYERKRDNFRVIDGRDDARAGTPSTPPTQTRRGKVISLRDSARRSPEPPPSRPSRAVRQVDAGVPSTSRTGGYASLRSKRGPDRKR